MDIEKNDRSPVAITVKDISEIRSSSDATGKGLYGEQFTYSDGLLTIYFWNDGRYYREFIISYDSVSRPISITFDAVGRRADITYFDDYIMLKSRGQSDDYSIKYVFNSDGKIKSALKYYEMSWNTDTVLTSYQYADGNLIEVMVDDRGYYDNSYTATATYDNGLNPFESSWGELVMFEYIYSYTPRRRFLAHSKNSLVNYQKTGNRSDNNITQSTTYIEIDEHPHYITYTDDSNGQGAIKELILYY